MIIPQYYSTCLECVHQQIFITAVHAIHLWNAVGVQEEVVKTARSAILLALSFMQN